MIKKIGIGLAIFLIPLAAIAGPGFTGLSIEGDAGFNNLSSQSIFDFNPSIGGAIKHNGATQTNFMGRIGVGYRFNLDRNFNLGAKVIFSSATGSINNAWVIPDTPTNGKLTDSLKASYSVTVLGEASYQHHRNLFAFVTGPERLNFNIRTIVQDGGVSLPLNYKKTETGWLFGLNLQQALTPHFSVIEGLSYTIIPKFTINTPKNVFMTKLQYRDLGIAAAQVGIAYNF